MLRRSVSRFITAVVAVIVNLGKMVEPPTDNPSNEPTPLSGRLRENVDFPLKMPTDWKWKGDESCPPLRTVTMQCRLSSKEILGLRPRPLHSAFSVSKRVGCEWKRLKKARMVAALLRRNLERAEEAEREAKRVRREAEQKMLKEADLVMKTNAVKYGLKDLCLEDANPARKKRGRHVLSLHSSSVPDRHIEEADGRPRKKRRTADPDAGSTENDSGDRMFSEWLERVAKDQEDRVWMRRM